MFDYTLLEDFISSHFPHLAFSFMYGSRAAGTARPDSDVDLIIVFENGHARPSRSLITHRDHIYDVSVMSLTTLKAFLDNAHSDYNYRLAFMLDSAVALPNGSVPASALIQQARQLIREMPRRPTPDSFRLFFTSQLSDLRHAATQSERTFLLIDAYHSIVQFAARSHGGGGGRKHAFGNIQRFEPRLLAELNSVFTAALSIDNPTQFLAFAERFLGQIGGPLREGYRE